jgi:hypothetical protein
VSKFLDEFFLTAASLETARGLTAVEQQELIRRRFSLLNYLLRSPLYDQKSKVWTLDAASVAYLFPALPTLYDQKSKVCIARIKQCFSLLNYFLRSLHSMIRNLRYVMRVRRCFSLLNYLLRSPLYDQKSKVYTIHVMHALDGASVAYLFPELPMIRSLRCRRM